jgi:hypothetical protein
MNIKQKLSDVSQYFINKLIDGEFELVSCDKYTAKVKIDTFIFELWISNDPPENLNFQFFSIDGGEDLIKFESDDQRVKVWDQIKPLVLKYKKEVMIKKKQEELRQLEEDMKNL